MTAKDYFITHFLETDLAPSFFRMSEDQLHKFAATIWTDALAEPVMIRGKLRSVRPSIQTWWNTIAYHERLQLTEIPDWLNL